MHYSPEEKDGVFVVEVSRGADTKDNYLSSEMMDKTPQFAHLQNDKLPLILNACQNSVKPADKTGAPSTNHIEVHHPPKGEEEKPVANGFVAKTGLTQSDLSINSSNSSNNYGYGTQEAYTVEQKAHYQASSPVNRMADNKVVNGDMDNEKPAVMPATFNNREGRLSIDAEGGLPLSSDVQAVARIMERQAATAAAAEALEQEAKQDENKNILGNISEESPSTTQETVVAVDEVDSSKPEVLEIIEGDTVHNGVTSDGQETLDSLSYLPPPPPNDDYKHLTDLSNQLDSLPPPPAELTSIPEVPQAEAANGDVANES
jgi:hypothetical protein